MESSRSLPLLLAVAVLLTGCTALQDDSGDQQDRAVTVTPTDGLSTRFSPASTTFLENEILRFKVTVENTGAADARQINPTSIGNPFIGTQCTPLQIPNRLSAADPSRGQPGGRAAFTWKCSAPLNQQGFNLPDGATDTFPAILQTTYGYRSTAETQVTFAQPSRFETSRHVSTDNQPAPVHMQIGLQTPVSPRSSLDIPITFRNVGDGEVRGAITYSVSVDGAEKISGQTTQLVDGRRQVIPTINGLNADVAEVTHRITVEATYTYKETASSRFTVQGQPANVNVEGLQGRVKQSGSGKSLYGD